MNIKDLIELAENENFSDAYVGVALRTQYLSALRGLVDATDKACELYFTDLDEVECEDVVIGEREQAIDDLMALWRDKLKEQLDGKSRRG